MRSWHVKDYLTDSNFESWQEDNEWKIREAYEEEHGEITNDAELLAFQNWTETDQAQSLMWEMFEDDVEGDLLSEAQSYCEDHTGTWDWSPVGW